jgi:hypothetical protein
MWLFQNQYHERAIGEFSVAMFMHCLCIFSDFFCAVFNERNLHRVFDVAYDGYVGGKDVQLLRWDDGNQTQQFSEAMEDTSKPYDGPSVVVLPLTNSVDWLPSPLILMDEASADSTPTLTTPESHAQQIKDFRGTVMNRVTDTDLKREVLAVIAKMYTELAMHGQGSFQKPAPDATISNEATHTRLAYQGTSRWFDGEGKEFQYQQGCGHHGADFIGAAAVRNGKALMPQANPAINTTTTLLGKA